MKRLLAALVLACVVTPGLGADPAAPATQPAGSAIGTPPPGPVLVAPGVQVPPMIPGRVVRPDDVQGQPLDLIGDNDLWISNGNPATDGNVTFRRAVKMEKAAFLGVSVSPIGDDTLRDQLKIPKGMGLVVDAVEKDSPADAAGVKPHDILTKLDDQKLVNPQQFEVLIRAQRPGDTVVLSVIHESKPGTVTAKLIEKELPVLDSLGLSPASGGPQFRVVMPPGALTPEGKMAPGGRVIGGGNVQVQRLPDGKVLILRDGGGPAPVAIGVGRAGAGMEQGATSSSMSISTDANGRKIATHTIKNRDGTFTLTTIDGQKHFVAKDPDEKVVFDGPVNTPEERQKIPAEILPRVEAMEAKSAAH